MTDTNQLPPLPPISPIIDHPDHHMTWTAIEIAWIKKYATTYALQARAQVQGELEPYDAGLLNDFGGGNVEWWQDYIRAELGRAHDFYQSQVTTPQPAQATQAEVTDAALIRALVDHIERNTCTHEETHRGGAIWEVCDSCGALGRPLERTVRALFEKQKD